MAQGIGSLTGAASNIANIGIGLAENRRRGQSHEMDMQKQQHDFDRQKQDEQLKDLFTAVKTGEEFGWGSPFYRKQVQPLYDKHGIAGERLNPETGSVDFYGKDPATGLEKSLFSLTTTQRQDLMRQILANTRNVQDTGGALRETYSKEGLGRTFEKTPPPESALSQEVKRAQIKSFQAQASKALAKPTMTWDDLSQFLAPYTKVNQFGEQHPLAERVSQLTGEASAKYPGDPVKALGYIMENIAKPSGAGGQKPLTPGTWGAERVGVPEGSAEQEAPPPKPRIPAPPPRPPEEMTPQARALRAEQARLRSLQGASDIETARDLEDQERTLKEQELALIERPKQQRTLREKIADISSRPGITDEAVANLVLFQWKGDYANRIATGFNRLFGGLRTAGLGYLTLEDVNAALSEAGVKARIAEEDGDYVAKPGPEPKKIAATGSAQGGIVRAPTGGAVDALTGTQVPEGIRTRVRNLAMSTGAPRSVGAGLVRITQGREA